MVIVFWLFSQRSVQKEHVRGILTQSSPVQKHKKFYHIRRRQINFLLSSSIRRKFCQYILGPSLWKDIFYPIVRLTGVDEICKGLHIMSVQNNLLSCLIKQWQSRPHFMHTMISLGTQWCRRDLNKWLSSVGFKRLRSPLPFIRSCNTQLGSNPFPALFNLWWTQNHTKPHF